MGRPAKQVRVSAPPPKVYRSSNEEMRRTPSVFAKYQIEIDSLLKTLTIASLRSGKSRIPSSSKSNPFPLKGGRLHNEEEEQSKHTISLRCEKAETLSRGRRRTVFSKIVSFTTNRESVSFSLVEHDVRIIQRLDEFRDDIWLQQDDFKRIKREAISSLRRIERGEATRQQDDDIRGLEVRIKDNAVCRKENRAQGIRKVLREQDMQWRKGTRDVQAIALTYKEISRPCHLTALLQGLEDQRES